MIDPQRYGEYDLPAVGAPVLSPSGRPYAVWRVVSAARVQCVSEFGVYVYFQANDLRKVKA